MRATAVLRRTGRRNASGPRTNSNKRLKAAKLNWPSRKASTSNWNNSKRNRFPGTRKWPALGTRTGCCNWPRTPSSPIRALIPASLRRSLSGGRKGKRPTEMFKRFTFTLNSRGDLGQVTKFLYDFYRGGHLHKIRTMSLNPIGQGQEVNLGLTDRSTRPAERRPRNGIDHRWCPSNWPRPICATTS